MYYVHGPVKGKIYGSARRRRLVLACVLTTYGTEQL